MSVQWCPFVLAALFAAAAGQNSSLIAEVTVSSQAVRVRGGESPTVQRAEVVPMPRKVRAATGVLAPQQPSPELIGRSSGDSGNALGTTSATDAQNKRDNENQFNTPIEKNGNNKFFSGQINSTSESPRDKNGNGTTSDPYFQQGKKFQRSESRESHSTINSELDHSSQNDDAEEGRGHMKKLKKQFKKIAPYLMVPGMMALGYAPFILASLKMFVMNALTLNMMAFNAAIFLTLRNMVFGPRRGEHVKYYNFGYKKKDPHPHPHHHHHHTYH